MNTSDVQEMQTVN